MLAKFLFNIVMGTLFLVLTNPSIIKSPALQPGFFLPQTFDVMHMYEAHENGFSISTDKSKLDLTVVHNYLSGHAYWAKNIPIEKVERCIQFSFCFGVYKGNDQIGFARLITDYTTYAYLADVFILPAYRGLGLAKWLMTFITTNPEVQGLRRWVLATQDAHGLYAQFGFSAYDKPERLMQRKDIESYTS